MDGCPAIRLECVEKWFGHSIVLQGVSFTVPVGDFMVLLGRNGAGKSTLLRVISRIIRPNSGKVEVCGVDILRKPEGRERTGFVAHSSYLYRNLTALENLRFFGSLYHLKNINEKIWNALDRVGLRENANRRVQEFSRGMHQRLSIARATLHNPDILLLDEPFSGLDLEASEQLGEWLSHFVADGKTVLMATHDLEQGLAGASHWAFVDRGKIGLEMRSTTEAVARERYRQFLKEKKL